MKKYYKILLNKIQTNHKNSLISVKNWISNLGLFEKYP